MWEQVVLFIVIAASAIVLFAWWYNVQHAALATKKVEACRVSVTAFAKSWVDVPATPFSKNDVHLVDIDCERRLVTFTKDHVELNGKKARFYDPAAGKWRSSYKVLTPAIVNSVAASEMATCWYEFLEGKSYWTNEIDWGDNDNLCFICGELHFDKEAKQAYENKDPTPFFNFLKEHESRPYPITVKKEGRPSYFDYLYLSERICNHDMSNSAGMSHTWYGRYLKDHPDATCEEAFFNFLQEKKWFNTSLVLNPDTSYRILFFQHGTDKGKKKGKVTGASYAPLLIPAEQLSTNLCERFLG